MKNHVRVNGCLLQTSKRFSALKEKQKILIYDITHEERERYIAKHGRIPFNHKKDDIIIAVLRRIEEREIWLPSGAAWAAIGKYIDRLNRRDARQMPSTSVGDDSPK